MMIWSKYAHAYYRSWPIPCDGDIYIYGAGERRVMTHLPQPSKAMMAQWLGFRTRNHGVASLESRLCCVVIGD